MIEKLFFTDAILTVFNTLLLSLALSAAEAYGGIFEVLSVVMIVLVILGALALVVLGIIFIWKE